MMLTAAAAVLLVHGVLIALFYRPQPKIAWGDEVFYLRAATALVAGSPSWHMEPLWPPLYPEVLGGVIALFGRFALPVFQALQTALLFGSALILGNLTHRLTRSPDAALVAGLLMVLSPEMVGFAHYLWPEILHLFLLLALLWILSERWQSLHWCALAGVSLGLAVLCKSILMPFIPILVAILLWKRPNKDNLLRSAVLLLGLAITVSPTLAANSKRLGRYMIADSAAFNVWVGLQDTARRNFDEQVAPEAFNRFLASGDTFAERDRWVKRQVRELLANSDLFVLFKKQLGMQYFRLFDKDSFLTMQLPEGPITHHGRGYVGRSPQSVRIVRLFSYALYIGVIIAAPIGFALLGAREERWVWVFVALLAYVLILSLGLHVKSRYRFQFMPLFFAYAGYLCAWLNRSSGLRRQQLPHQRRRLFIGLLSSALLLFLATGGAWLRG